MAKVEVVNRQVIAGKERKRGEVIDVSDGHARDLIADGKVRLFVAPEPVVPVEVPDKSAESVAKPAAGKAGK